MDKAAAKNRIAALAKQISRHDRFYYIENAPQISDASYDEFRKELEALEKEFPDLVTDDSPTRRVGAPPRSSLPPVDHLMPMLSLGTRVTESGLIARAISCIARVAAISRLTFVCAISQISLASRFWMCRLSSLR